VETSPTVLGLLQTQLTLMMSHTSIPQEPGTVLSAVGMMDLAYVCEWEKWPKITYCPSVPLACAWSCRNLIAFTTDLRNDDQGVSPNPRWCWACHPIWDCQT
jgi:hypothetical protein